MFGLTPERTPEQAPAELPKEHGNTYLSFDFSPTTWTWCFSLLSRDYAG
jgi:hypothetical protein